MKKKDIANFGTESRKPNGIGEGLQNLKCQFDSEPGLQSFCSVKVQKPFYLVRSFRLTNRQKIIFCYGRFKTQNGTFHIGV